MPEAPTLAGLEGRWTREWDEQGTYRFSADQSTTRDQVYSIDTPPPTASGSLHIGHVFSYTHTDLLARYWRMRGKHVFYPMGWDDSGLPTERRAQRFFGVTCDPSMPYDPDFRPFARGRTDEDSAAAPVPIDRRNFTELCARLAREDEESFKKLFRHLGLSVDWTYTYSTIDTQARATSQRTFIAELQAGRAYQVESAGLWDITFQTALAQAEVVARDYSCERHRVVFHSSSGPIPVETTRPELLPSAVALVIHPEDRRHERLLGTTVRSPLFDIELPVIGHSSVDPDKGTGIAMCCTFSDLDDVACWHEFDLPTRPVLGRDGHFIREVPPWLVGDAAQNAYRRLANKDIAQARAVVVAALRDSGNLDGEPVRVQKKAKFYEKGDSPLEVATNRQWYISNGGRDIDLRRQMLRRGAELNFQPSFMRTRYNNWLTGLSDDWLISRQRSYGVPMPLWYPLDENGEPDFQKPLTPSIDDLPVDPAIDVPDGYTPDQRGVPGGFTGEPYLLDVWATTSLTPQIAGRWISDPQLFAQVYPFDLHPQGQDIIRTWLFSTVLRAQHRTGELPWKTAAVSGWVLDPDGEKMSKSKGKTVQPLQLFEEYGVDAVRYWAASCKLGTDANLERAKIKVGRRLALKLLNVGRFVLSLETVQDCTISEVVDRAMLARLADVVREATAAFEDHEHQRALILIEAEFRQFCRHYVELVKQRAGSTGAAAQSARGALLSALDVYLRLLAPYLPFVTEEVWSWWRDGSVHRSSWPNWADVRALAGEGNDAHTLADAIAVLAGIRKAKSAANEPPGAKVRRAVVTGPAQRIDHLRRIEPDLRSAGHVVDLVFAEGGSEIVVSQVDIALS